MLGQPKYNRKDKVSFRLNNKIVRGVIWIVDAYGTFFQTEEPSYDVFCEEENTLYKHIPESQILNVNGDK